MTDPDDQATYDLEYERRHQLKAAAARQAQADARHAEQELTRPRRRTTWAEAIRARVAAGQTVRE